MHKEGRVTHANASGAVGLPMAVKTEVKQPPGEQKGISSTAERSHRHSLLLTKLLLPPMSSYSLLSSHLVYSQRTRRRPKEQLLRVVAGLAIPLRMCAVNSVNINNGQQGSR